MGTALSLANLSQSPEAQSKASTTLVQSQGETTSLSPCQAASSHVVSKTMTICQSQPSIHPSSGAESVRNSNLQPQKTLNIQSIELDKDFQDLRANVEVESLKLTQCHVCKKDFEALEGLEIHLRTHLANEPSRCGLCHFTAQDREELRQHILGMHHQSLNDIEASVLAMEVEEQSLRKGETVQSRQLTLRNALTAVKQLYSLKKHKHPSQQDKPGLSTTGSVQCMVCNKFFRGSSYLRQHMRTHTGDRPHQCQHCGRSFTSRDILKKHMYVHQERKDYKCGECGKLFKRLGHVQQHLRTHSQERAFRCSMCDKLFKTQHSLKVHLRTHSGINPYKCPVCNNHFRERGSLQRHMRLHTGEKPFKCHLCNRAFSEQGTLSRHLKAKVPCSASRDQTNVPSQASVDQNVRAEDFSNVLPQLTPVVPSNQQILLNTNQVTTVQQEMSQGIGQQQFFVQTGQVQEVSCLL
ncbi:transcription factor e4f1-like [Plakobranchus ocellatus]|uniref:Transcription factor e4f1-like n=1 Tax=Plakobranchus ocellatus TaxID=259542 RepID=A0AAV4A2M8_9GAST|nr:transcription factor e4f1-like [Plakobranchus ocellatus]